jgi:pimeloyl-ACP methyl ester carboxylesterase
VALEGADVDLLEPLAVFVGAPVLPLDDDRASFDDYAQVVAESLHEREPAVLVGHSMSSAVIPLVAIRRPVRRRETAAWGATLGGGRPVSPGHRERHCLAGDDLVYGVGELEQHAVRPGEQADQDHGLAAGVDEMPGSIVDGDMDVADTRRHVKGALAEHRHDTEVLRSILNKDLAGGQWPRQWRIDNQLRWRLIRYGNEWR